MASTPIAARGVLEQRYSTVSSTTSYQTAGSDTPSATSSVVALGLNGKAATSQTTVTPSEAQQQQQQSLAASLPPHILPPSPPPSIRAHSIKDEPTTTTTIIPDAPIVENDPAPVICPPEPEPEPQPEAPPPILRALTIDPSSIQRPSHSKAQTQTQAQPQPQPHAGPSGLSALQPPPPPVSFRTPPTRRNTTPAGGSRTGSGDGAGGHSQRGTSKSSIGPGVDLALDDDIMKQAEQIRRERFNKRTKQEAYEASRSKDRSSQDGEDERPVVGNIIKEGHVNYVLMYNMLTGIRIAVSRCQAKPKRPLTDEDYLAKHKYSFDIVGNELTPSAKYDFKFKDYAPWIFRDLRETYFHIDPADYLLSLTSKYILSELGSPGKSGSFFYFSRDYKYIIKTIHHTEHKYLLSILKSYHNHVKTNPHTLISRFYGLHRVKLPRGRKIHFVIMNNLFPPHRDIHETYDLKGSTVGRLYPEEKAKDNSKAVLKDLNWINRHKTLEFGKEKRALLTEQLRLDSEWLKSINVMDYSLLIGIHNMQRGNRDNLRSNTLKVFQPNTPTAKHKSRQSQSATALRRAIRQSAPPQSLSLSPTQLLPEPENYASTEGGTYDTIFYGDEGGFRATADITDGSGVAGPSLGLGVGQLNHRRASTSNDVVASSSAIPMRDIGHKRASTSESGTIRPSKPSVAGVGGEKELDTIYYLGIIDILTPYTVAKRVEGLWKGLSADRHKISPVPAVEYGDRFLDFLTAIMPGGGGGERFKAE